MARKQLVNIGYTGGLDSSYAMIMLSTLDVAVQPYYLKDIRASEEHELASISTVIEDIRSNRTTRCEILPLITMATADVEKDQDVTDAYHRLHKKTNLGSQYDWLARFAKSVKGLCLSLERSPSGHATVQDSIAQYGDITLQTEGEFAYYVVDPERSSPDLITVFGRFRFPHAVWHKTKLEQAEDLKQLGFEHALRSTWFCFTPIEGEPCGVCNPCISYIEDGMAWRFSKEALRRYRMRKAILPLRKSKRLLTRAKRKVF